MTAPPCGHDDGWCGGVLNNNYCVQRPRRHTGPVDTTDYELLVADNAERRGVMCDDFYERAGTWER